MFIGNAVNIPDIRIKARPHKSISYVTKIRTKHNANGTLKFNDWNASILNLISKKLNKATYAKNENEINHIYGYVTTSFPVQSGNRK